MDAEYHTLRTMSCQNLEGVNLGELSNLRKSATLLAKRGTRLMEVHPHGAMGMAACQMNYHSVQVRIRFY